MPPAQPAFKFTCEDYRTAPPDRRYELLDGQLFMTQAPNLKHLRVARTFGRGEVLRSPLLEGFALAVDDIFNRLP